MTKSEIFYSIINRNDKNECKSSGLCIDKVVMNSKEIEKGDLFIAIRGGNNFVNESLLKGAYVVYDNESIKLDVNNKEKAFLVEDSIIFMQEFAKKWRENLNLKVIGITGSNGKTTVKDMIYHLLKSKYKGKKTDGNYNNHIGLPFTLLCSEVEDEFIILEMGMSDFNEIDLLGQISSPNISVITNIGESHLEFLKTKENVFKAKTEIIPYIKETLIINGDDEYLRNVVSDKIRIIKVLRKEKKDLLCEKMNFYYGDISFNEIETNFSLDYFGQICQSSVKRSYKTNVLGEHNILNLTIAIAVAKQFGIEDKIIEENVKNIAMTEMRFQKIEKKDTVYINDAYNASPMSMKKSLETFSKLYNNKEKVVVLGDMLELGENEREFHRDIFDILLNINTNKIYLYGPRMASLYEKLEKNKNIKEFLNKDIKYFENKMEIKKELEKISKEKAVLLKASRGMKLEDIIEDIIED